jgi:hypothetical protein
MQLCPFPCDFLNLWLNILDILSSNILSVWPFPNARGKFSRRHKQEAVMYSLIFMYWNARREDERILLNTYKGKVKLSVCTAWRQVASGEGVNSTAPLILDLGCRWMGVVSFTIQPFYPPGKSPRCQLNRRLGWYRWGLDDFGEQRVSCPCLESSHNLVTTLSLSRTTISSAHNIII